jgi:thiamine biosynthesis lipoprotein
VTATLGRAAFGSLGTTAEVYTADDAVLDRAVELLVEELAAMDAACSRFRPDSEISLLHERAGRPVRVSRLLAEALAVSLDAARATDGLVDPTVGTAVRALGYDSDFALVAQDSDQAVADPVAAPGWWRVALDERERFALLPRGIDLDLGATAKALAADRAAARISAETGCGVLVNLGGDLTVSGPAPDGGWVLRVCDDHAAGPDEAGPMVTVESGGVATSSTTVRTWRRAGRRLHHVVDPRTGDIVAPVWRTVTVAAATCVEANTATTASLVLGHDAPAWLGGLGLPARLVALDGGVLTLGGWPPDEAVRAAG